MKIEINNLTKAQEIALEDMFATWVQLGNVGCSRWTAFFSDGDGNFRPKITVDGHKAEKTELIDTLKKWRTIKLRTKYADITGKVKTNWEEISQVYMLDFNSIVLKLKEEKNKK